jgi:GNAT superfamily N-acetyltransferase
MARAPPVALRLRRAGPADLAVLTAHRRGMWRDIGIRTSTSALDASDPVYRRWLARMMRRGRAVAWIVEGPGGTPAGSGVVWLPEAQPRPGDLGLPRPYLMSMYTAPSFRRRGVARRIVVAALDWARSKGYRRFTLHASTMGRPIYARLGFRPGREMIRTLARRPRSASTPRRRA